MIQSSLALCLGFLVLRISPVASMARSGAVSSGVILAALYGDVMFLPAVIGE
jgi:hypothetical protein